MSSKPKPEHTNGEAADGNDHDTLDDVIKKIESSLVVVHRVARAHGNGTTPLTPMSSKQFHAAQRVFQELAEHPIVVDADTLTPTRRHRKPKKADGESADALTPSKRTRKVKS